MPAEWTWFLADANGTKLGELTTASGKRLEFKRNQPARASCTIYHEDDAAQLLADAYVASGPPILFCYRKGDSDTEGILRFAGHIAPGLGESAEADIAKMELVFLSPFARLLGANGAYGRWTDREIVASGQDAGVMAAELVKLYGGVLPAGSGSAIFTGATANGAPIGLDIGNIEITKNRDRTYTFYNVGEAITNLTNVLDGFDFEERFQDVAGAPIALLDIFAEAGVIQPNARFEYGADTLNNARIFSRTTSPPVNHVRALGAGGIVGMAQDTASIERYGRYEQVISMTTVIEQATIDDKAHALLRPNPVKTVSFGPELGLESAPKVWDDYWLGDTVSLYARHFALTEDQRVRVNGVNVVIDDQGFESAEIEDPSTPEEDSVLRASLAVEVVE